MLSYPKRAAISRVAQVSMIIACGTVICGMAGCQGPTYTTLIYPPQNAPPLDVCRKLNATLDDFHDAAAKADGPRYFAHFAPEAAFIGTDATEYWLLKDFKTFAEPYFSKGKGWTYTLYGMRNFIEIDDDVVAFDELLDNAKLGRCRGSGVLVQRGSRWRIQHYVLSMTIPNEIAEDVAKQSRAVIKEPK